MIVPYSKFPSKQGDIFRPVIAARFSLGIKAIPIMGLLDSGADRVLINKAIGRQLGVDFKSCRLKKMSGISGKPQTTWDTTLTMEVKNFDGFTFQADVSFIDSANVGLLLGHKGFFEFFDIKFQTLQEQFEIELAVPPHSGFKLH